MLDLIYKDILRSLLDSTSVLVAANRTWKYLSGVQFTIENPTEQLLSDLPLTRSWENYSFQFREPSDWIEGCKGTPYGLSILHERRRIRSGFNGVGEYDYLTKSNFGRVGGNQTQRVIELLKSESGSRSAVLCNWNSDRDLLQKNLKSTQSLDRNQSIPCLLNLTINRIKDKDYSASVFLRACDWDVTFFQNYHTIVRYVSYILRSSVTGSKLVRLNFSIGNVTLDSYSDHNFRRQENLLKWWVNSTFQPSVDSIETTEKPKFYEDQWNVKESAIWEIFNGHINDGLKTIASMKDGWYKDWALCEALTLALTLNRNVDHVSKFFWDSDSGIKFQKEFYAFTPTSYASSIQSPRLKRCLIIELCTKYSQQGKYSHIVDLVNLLPESDKVYAASEILDFLGAKERKFPDSVSPLFKESQILLSDIEN